MSFAPNSSNQISLFDATSNLTEREKKLLDKFRAKYFSNHIFPSFDEQPLNDRTFGRFRARCNTYEESPGLFASLYRRQ